jgi:hypothetical protein
MRAQDGRPECCTYDTFCLGIRVNTERDDLDLDENGFVQRGGMSVCPDQPDLLMRGLRPESMGGNCPWPLWRIPDASLPPTLVFVPDPPAKGKPRCHGTIRPREPMQVDAYLAALCTTRGLWERVP